VGRPFAGASALHHWVSKFWGPQIFPYIGNRLSQYSMFNDSIAEFNYYTCEYYIVFDAFALIQFFFLFLKEQKGILLKKAISAADSVQNTTT
jgi:hypothetical protein